MGIVVFVLLMIGVVIVLRKTVLRKKVVRRLSDDRAAHEATRVPVTRKCDCGMPRCRYKNKKHPPAVANEAPLRNRNKYGR